MHNKTIFVILTIAAPLWTAAQTQDTVIVPLANKSQIIFTVGEKDDLTILKHYDFQELFQDMIRRLEEGDTTGLASTEETVTPEISTDHETHESTEDWEGVYIGDSHWGNTWQSINFDFGMNNYLEDGQFPDNEDAPYSVRPWGSWYFAIASIQRTRVSKTFFLEWGLGVNWYSFKFQDDDVRIVKTPEGVEFINEDLDYAYKKSKLTASYLQASFVPVIDFGGNSRKPRFWEDYKNSFRVGAGGYIGYRIGSHSKLVYEEDGDKVKDKQFDGLYLTNFRYGLRFQIGFRSTDLFFNYDLNELFSEGKGPALNAFSFGFIL